MAWRSSGVTNEDLIEKLWANKLITDPDVKAAFLSVDRAHYAPTRPYDDAPQAIGHGATISAPHMHANSVERLLPFIRPSASGPSRRVLDVGSGSGYLTHVLAVLAGPDGVVVGVEHVEALRALGEANVAKSAAGRDLLASGRVRFRKGDGRLGWTEEGLDGGWDAIHVGASAKEVHEGLLNGLKRPGAMFIPVDDEDGGGGQHVWVVEKDAQGQVTKRRLFGVRYVPLTDAPR